MTSLRALIKPAALSTCRLLRHTSAAVIQSLELPESQVRIPHYSRVCPGSEAHTAVAFDHPDLGNTKGNPCIILKMRYVVVGDGRATNS